MRKGRKTLQMDGYDMDGTIPGVYLVGGYGKGFLMAFLIARL